MDTISFSNMSLYFTALYYSDIRNIILRLFNIILPYWKKGPRNERRVDKPWEDAEINHITLEKSSGLRTHGINSATSLDV